MASDRILRRQLRRAAKEHIRGGAFPPHERSTFRSYLNGGERTDMHRNGSIDRAVARAMNPITPTHLRLDVVREWITHEVATMRKTNRRIEATRRSQVEDIVLDLMDAD